MEVTMTFGKHKGTPLREVPVEYLTWALDSMTNCPAYIIIELTRRGSLESGAALLAQTSVNNARWRQARRESRGNAKYRKHQLAAARKQGRLQGRAERNRASAIAKVDAMKAGIMIVGSEYHRLVEEYCGFGYETSSCPFDCDDYLYEGPTLGAAAGVREDWLAEFTAQTSQPV